MPLPMLERFAGSPLSLRGAIAMNGFLYIYLLGLNESERIRVAKEYCRLHFPWLTNNVRKGANLDFIHTNDYKIIQTRNEISFEVADIVVNLTIKEDGDINGN